MMAAKSAEMNKLAIQILMAMALTIAALLAFAKGASAGDISVAHASVSHLKGARTAAVHFDIINSGLETDALIGISADVADEAMLHEMKNENNIMHMRMVERLDVVPGEPVDFRKSGLHVMLAGLKAPLVSGDVVKLQLTFEKSGAVEVEATVQ
jgi:periplasmic copper chaperone A